MFKHFKIKLLRFGYLGFVRAPVILFYSFFLVLDVFSRRQDKKLLNQYAIWYYSRVTQRDNIYFGKDAAETYLFKLAMLNKIKKGFIDFLPGDKHEESGHSTDFHFQTQKISSLEKTKSQPTKLYKFCKKSAYLLVKSYGDISGAKQAFDNLNPVTLLQNEDIRQKAALMQLLLDDVINIEVRMKKDSVLFKSDNGKPRVVISIMVWGEQYLNYFCTYCIPSLRAKGNLCDFQEIDIFWHIFSTTQGKKYLNSNKIFEKFVNTASVRYETIPDSLLAISSRKNRYWILGAYTQTSLRYAAHLDADIHFTNPDVIYAANFFKNLFFIKHTKRANLILSGSVSAKSKNTCKELEKLKSADDRLNISAGELHELALDNLQELYHNCFLSPAGLRSCALPGMPLLGWIENDTLVMHIRYLNPMLIDKRLLTTDMQLSYYTIDSEIIGILQKKNNEDLNYYIIQSEDDVGFIEISEIKSENTQIAVSREKFRRNFKGTKGISDFMLFCDELRLPLNNSGKYSSKISNNAAKCKEQFENLINEIKDYLEVIH